VRRRLFVAFLAAGLLLVAGFTAAAVASGGSPFGLLEHQPATADDTTTDRDTLDRATTEPTTSAESTEDESGEDEKANRKTTTEATDATSSSHKVTICHQTGSKKHPFHPISVDEHALSAHTDHGDTVGPCPAATAGAAPAAKHAKPKHSGDKTRAPGGSHRSEQGRLNGNGQAHGPGKHAGGPNK
jgi:hypothetical protein